jgi:hypothetical protein
VSLTDLLAQTRTVAAREGVGYAARHTTHEAWLGLLRRLEAFTAPGESHWNREWDVLLVLDACRVDLFRSVCDEYDWLPAPGDVDRLRSVASSSEGWIRRTFGDDHAAAAAETGYVTGNMFYDGVPADRFGLLWPVEPERLADHDIVTVDPTTVTDAAVATWRRRSELGLSRLVVHYMQPHTPFRSRPEWFDDDRPNRTSWGESFVDLRDGGIDPDSFERAYRDNLRWVLDEVEQLVRNCEARIALSADHGNALGEWGVYGHPNGMPVSAVRSVPFTVVSGEDTGEYDPPVDPTNDRPSLTTEQTRQHLRSLGYAE